MSKTEHSQATKKLFRFLRETDDESILKVKEAIKEGADVNAINEEENTPLHWATPEIANPRGYYPTQLNSKFDESHLILFT